METALGEGENKVAAKRFPRGASRRESKRQPGEARLK